MGLLQPPCFRPTFGGIRNQSSTSDVSVFLQGKHPISSHILGALFPILTQNEIVHPVTPNNGALGFAATPIGGKNQNAPKLDTSHPHLLTAQKGPILTEKRKIGSQFFCCG